MQGFLAKLGIDRSYVLVNAFLYSVFGQGGGERNKNDPGIIKYRNKWFDAVFATSPIEAVVGFGRLADLAWTTWRKTPKGSAVAVTYQAVHHPTFPESSSASGQMTKAEAMAKMLVGWNAALKVLSPAITQPDVQRPLKLYDSSIAPEELAPIPECDLPPGLPAWMGSIDAWASRRTAGEAEGPTALPRDVLNAKRATIVVRIPRKHRTWPPVE